MVVLARCGLPRLGTRSAAKLDRVPLLRIQRGHPVEAVAAEVHEPAALPEVALQRVQHLLRPVLGVGAGDNYAIRLQQRSSFRMEVSIRDHVPRVARLLQPIDQVQVGVEAVGSGGDRADLVMNDLGPHVEDGSPARGMNDPAAVGVVAVEAQQLGCPPLPVPVRKVGEGGGQEGDRRGRGSRSRSDVEGT